jgi:putative ATPase
VLDLRAESGLLLWEALRRAPEGGVWALARPGRGASALADEARRLAALEAPALLEGSPRLLEALLADDPDLRFDAVVGHNALVDVDADEAVAIAAAVAARLAPGGRVVVADVVPRRTQRLHRLVDLAPLGADLAGRARAAEEAIYEDRDDPLVAWDVADRLAAWRRAGLDARAELVPFPREVRVDGALLHRWFAPSEGPRPSYGDFLARGLTAAEVAVVRARFERALLGETVAWEGTIALVTATAAD